MRRRLSLHVVADGLQACQWLELLQLGAQLIASMCCVQRCAPSQDSMMRLKVSACSTLGKCRALAIPS